MTGISSKSYLSLYRMLHNSFFQLSPYMFVFLMLPKNIEIKDRQTLVKHAVCVRRDRVYNYNRP